MLFVLAAFVGATHFLATRVLRLLGVAGPVAAIAARVLLASPLSVAFYQEAGSGFYVETLVPALCLILDDPKKNRPVGRLVCGCLGRF